MVVNITKDKNMLERLRDVSAYRAMKHPIYHFVDTMFLGVLAAYFMIGLWYLAIGIAGWPWFFVVGGLIAAFEFVRGLKEMTWVESWMDEGI